MADTEGTGMQAKSVTEILTENGLSEYIAIFEQNKLTSADVLADLSENDYIQIGVTILGDRKKMIKLFSGNAAAGGGSPGVQASGSQIGQQIVIQAGPRYLPMKSMAAAILLPLFFGCFGMFYASAGMGIFGLLMYGATFIITFVTFGIGAILWVPVHLIAIIATAVSVSGHNNRLIAKSNESKTVTQ